MSAGHAYLRFAGKVVLIGDAISKRLRLHNAVCVVVHIGLLWVASALSLPDGTVSEVDISVHIADSRYLYC